MIVAVGRVPDPPTGDVPVNLIRILDELRRAGGLQVGSHNLHRRTSEEIVWGLGLGFDRKLNGIPTGLQRNRLGPGGIPHGLARLQEGDGPGRSE